MTRGFLSIRKKRTQKNKLVLEFGGFGLKTTYTLGTDKVGVAKNEMLDIQNRCTLLEKDRSHDFYSWNKKEKKAFIFGGVTPKHQMSGIANLAAAVETYINKLKTNGTAFNTWSQYERELKASISFFGDIELSRLSPSNLQEFVVHLSSKTNSNGQNRGHNPKPKTVKVHLDCLKRCFKYLVGLGQIENLNLTMFDSLDYGKEKLKETSKLTPYCDIEDRFKELKRFSIPQTEEQAFAKVIYSQVQRNELLEFLNRKLFIDGTLASTRIYAAIFFALVTGCRRSELTRIQRSDFLLDDEQPQVEITKMKGRGDFAVLRQKMTLPEIIVPVLTRLLRILPPEQKHIFCADDDHLLPTGAWCEKESRLKAEYLSDQHVEALKDSKWQHVTRWHVYRHTLASQLLEEGYSQQEVKETIGWCSDEMAQRYQHLLQERKAQIINSVF